MWSWQETVKAVFLDRVNVVSEYERVIHSPSWQMRLPSVISLKEYVPLGRSPAFTRFNVFLRDRFSCQYCDVSLPSELLTFDHVVPRSRGGTTTWENVVTACESCNLLKGNRLPQHAGVFLQRRPYRPITNCVKTAAAFRLTTCTKAGATFCTGIRNWKPPEAGWRGLTGRDGCVYCAALFPGTWMLASRRASYRRCRPTGTTII